MTLFLTMRSSLRTFQEWPYTELSLGDSSLGSARGRSLHTKSAHPVEYFEGRSRLAPSRTNWSAQEDYLLRRCATAFPTRSEEALYSRLRSLHGQEPLLAPPALVLPVDPTPTTSYSNPTAPVIEQSQNQAYRDSLLHSAVELLAESPCAGLATEELLSLALDLLMDEDRLSEAGARLDSHALSVFPKRWSPGVHRRPVAKARPLNGRSRRRAQYAEVQARLAKNFKAGAQFVLSGDWRTAPCPESPLPPGMFEFWRELTERPSNPDPRPTITPATVAWAILDPISPTEVTRNLRLMQDSAAGIDGLSAKDLLRWPPSAIAGYLNVILATCHMPAQHCICRTTLVPKARSPKSPSEFRPIAVSNVLPRLLTRILAQRWSRHCPTSRFQFGFQERDGTAEATALLHGMLRHAVSAPRSIAVAVLDVAKAFDSVNHGTLLRAAAAHGAPPPLLTLLASSYSRTSTYILGTEVRCLRGLGFEMDGVTVDCIAYADDLVLFAESPQRLQQRLDGLANGLSHAGMVLNSAKCVAFYVQALGKEKSACLRPCDVSIGGSALRSLGPTDTFKYLGVPFSYRGKVTVSHHSVLYNMLQEVTKAPLKPQQRLSLLKQHCVPKLLHELVLGAVHRNTLKRLDVQIRQAVRLWLRLPTDTPTSFLHAAVRDGGIGVPCLAVMVPFAKKRRLDSVLSSQEPAVRAAATVPSALPGMRMAAQPVRLGQTVLASKLDAKEYWRTSLYESADGRPLLHFANSTCANHWLSSPVRVFPWLFLRGIQLRAGVLSTKARRSRRTGREDVLCRGECGQRETLFHILQCCHLTHHARVWRHNLVMRLLAQRLLKDGRE
ncbi:unnamed protein product, partial [Dibothriocephalus latus]